MKILELGNNLNDDEKVIILDNKGNPQMVLMSYLAYENLKTAKGKELQTKKACSQPESSAENLTSTDVLAKINAEIAQWKINQNNPIELDDGLLIKLDDSSDTDEEEEVENSFYLETIDE